MAQEGQTKRHYISFSIFCTLSCPFSLIALLPLTLYECNFGFTQDQSTCTEFLSPGQEFVQTMSAQKFHS